MLENIILFLIIAGIVGGASAKLIKDKKNGAGCSGCPHYKGCSTKAVDSTESVDKFDKSEDPY